MGLGMGDGVRWESGEGEVRDGGRKSEAVLEGGSDGWRG